MERRAPGRRRKKNRATSVFVLLAILCLIAGFLARRIMAPAAVYHLRTLPALPLGDPPSNTGRRGEAGASKADGSRQSAPAAFPNAYNAERNREDLTPDERQALDRIIREHSHAPEADE
jgi:hypothetical protein